MTIAIWRIAADTPDYGADDLSGRGAELTGGRWTRKGVPCLYCSSSIALACLETLVHLGGAEPLPLNRYLVRLEVSDAAWAAREVLDLNTHVGWDALPAGLISLNWGTQWSNSSRSLLAQVPSIVIPEEPNYLINPRHPEAGRLVAARVRRWLYDARIGYRTGARFRET